MPESGSAKRSASGGWCGWRPRRDRRLDARLTAGGRVLAAPRSPVSASSEATAAARAGKLATSPFNCAAMLPAWPQGQRAVPAGVGMDLRPVEADGPQLRHPRLARHAQDIGGQRRDVRQKPPPERRDHGVAGRVAGRDATERHRAMSRQSRAAMASARRAQVHPLDHELREVVLRQPFVHRGRQKNRRVAIDVPEIARRRGVHLAGAN